MKPESLTEIKKGNAIGSPKNQGFADTYNYMVRFIRNLHGDGHWITVDNPQGDNPTITIGDDFLDEIGGGGGADCDLTPTLSEGTKIATWTKDGVDTDIYAPSGGGECTCEMEATCPHYDKDAEGQTQQYWPNAEVGKFTDCDGNETTLYAPNHIQVKGNAYPYWSNLTDKIELVSASDSNVRITPDGNKLTIGCYYIGILLMFGISALFV